MIGYKAVASAYGAVVQKTTHRIQILNYQFVALYICWLEADLH